mmetsp:Transcript_20234/g.43213  ORF Transcript_20234/g.43213 Transcript_20234/m.43213 type:complete len:248 (+) Transcript_20234:125-868(+)
MSVSCLLSFSFSLSITNSFFFSFTVSRSALRSLSTFSFSFSRIQRFKMLSSLSNSSLFDLSRSSVRSFSLSTRSSFKFSISVARSMSGSFSTTGLSFGFPLDLASDKSSAAFAPSPTAAFAPSPDKSSSTEANLAIPSGSSCARNSFTGDSASGAPVVPHAAVSTTFAAAARCFLLAFETSFSFVRAVFSVAPFCLAFLWSKLFSSFSFPRFIILSFCSFVLLSRCLILLSLRSSSLSFFIDFLLAL